MAGFWKIYWRALKIPALPVIWVVASLFGIVAGPFNTLESMSLGARVIFWPLSVAVGILIGAAIRIFVRRKLGLRRFRYEAPTLAGLSALVLTVPLYLLVLLLAAKPNFRGFEIFHMAGYILGLSMAGSTLRHWMAPQQGRPKRTQEASVDAAEKQARRDVEAAGKGALSSPTPRLLYRLEPDLRAPLIRLAVNDHYVDVVTEAGETSLLIRLADAIAETEGAPGLQVHRSHWVARDAVRGMRKEKGRVFLQMADGVEVPVSRTYQPQVEAARFRAPDTDGMAAQ
ncbi:LytTR family DNA-binding domain-containing protein [Thioclava sp. JE_KL1]|uniref:LytTR family DNA-binding domain-containing protein n=1 Tax=Thioclava sp. JE_KL1 TaxID=2651187 RepID=UPI00128B4817|nr:LytTR family DNA-binding domain-containing protein [Thioclava sp. JE_KL1]MPQ95107.1 LytTR family transcriptional regulator [Thioclava sp. JE_KL1]